MPWQQFLPLVRELPRLQAQAIYTAIHAARIAEADPGELSIRALVDDLRRAAFPDRPRIEVVNGR